MPAAGQPLPHNPSPIRSTASPATSLEWLSHTRGSVLVAFQKGLPAVLDVERCLLWLLAEAADGGEGEGLKPARPHPCGPGTWRFDVDGEGEAAEGAASPETGDRGSTPSSRPAAPGASRLQFACCACSLQPAQGEGEGGEGGEGAATACAAVSSTTGALTLLRLSDGQRMGRRSFPAQLHLGVCASPSGTVLALSTQMAVRLLEVSPDLPPVARLRDAVAPQPYTLLAFTADGNGLVASPGHKGRDRGRVVHAWRLDVAHEVLHVDVEGGVAALVGHPARNALAAIEADGGFLLWREQPPPSDWPVRALAECPSSLLSPLTTHIPPPSSSPAQGPMFPVGFRVIPDNEEYSEPETEFDAPPEAEGEHRRKACVDETAAVDVVAAVPDACSRAPRRSGVDGADVQALLAAESLQALSPIVPAAEEEGAAGEGGAPKPEQGSGRAWWRAPEDSDAADSGSEEEEEEGGDGGESADAAIKRAAALPGPLAAVVAEGCVERGLTPLLEAAGRLGQRASRVHQGGVGLGEESRRSEAIKRARQRKRKRMRSGDPSSAGGTTPGGGSTEAFGGEAGSGTRNARRRRRAAASM